MSSITAPPQIICMPMLSSDDLGLRRVARIDEPSAHAAGAESSASAASGGIVALPERIARRDDDRHARKAQREAAQTCPPGARPRGRSHSMRIIQSGVAAIISAHRPEGTVRSAHESVPLPSSSSSAPTIAELRQLMGSGRASPRARLKRIEAKRLPSRKREPAIRNGGIVSTATRMPKYVEPQMR